VPPGNRGAPARGVDVKPLAREGQNGPKRPKTPEKGVRPPKRPKKAFFPENGQKWPFFKKNPKNPGFRGPRAGVLHQPLAGPAGPGSGTLRGPEASREGSPSPGAGIRGSRIRDLPGPGPGDPPGQGPGTSQRPPGPPRARPRRGFYINPSRRGPAVPGGPGSQETPRSVESLQAAPALRVS